MRSRAIEQEPLDDFLSEEQVSKKEEIAQRKAAKKKQRLLEAYEREKKLKKAQLQQLAWEAGLSVSALKDPETLAWAITKVRWNEIKPAVIKGSKSDARVEKHRKKGDAEKIRRRRRKQLGIR